MDEEDDAPAVVDVSGKDGEDVGVAEASEAHDRLLLDDGDEGPDVVDVRVRSSDWGEES